MRTPILHPADWTGTVDVAVSVIFFAETENSIAQRIITEVTAIDRANPLIQINQHIVLDLGCTCP